MAAYTYAPAPVLVETTGEFAIGAEGILRQTSNGDPVQAYDLNDLPINSIVVNPKGAHQAFKADISDGILDFGSVLLPANSLEQMRAGLTAVQTANQAVSIANQALEIAGVGAVVHGVGDVVATTDEETGDVTITLTAALAAIAFSGSFGDLVGIPNLAVIVRHEGGVDPNRPAWPGPVIWDVPNADRPAVNGSIAGGAYAAVDNVDYIWTH